MSGWTVRRALDLERTAEPDGDLAPCVRVGEPHGLAVDYVTMRPGQRIEPHVHDDQD
jgi:quercetin dioxygenase-like cupin family protein